MSSILPEYVQKSLSIMVCSPGDYEKWFTEHPPGLDQYGLADRINEIQSVISDHGGFVISQYPPPVIAIWPADDLRPDCRACDAAAEIKRLLAQRALGFDEALRKVVSARIGLSCGTGIVQVQGGKYSHVIGDVVNRATCLHDMASDEAELLLDDDFARYCDRYQFKEVSAGVLRMLEPQGRR
jgi:class 3 adenylate cyclase